jgi:hypothetical protein
MQPLLGPVGAVPLLSESSALARMQVALDILIHHVALPYCYLISNIQVISDNLMICTPLIWDNYGPCRKKISVVYIIFLQGMHTP